MNGFKLHKDGAVTTTKQEYKAAHQYTPERISNITEDILCICGLPKDSGLHFSEQVKTKPKEDDKELREKIEKIIDNQFIPIDIGVYDRSIDTILSLIQQEVRECIGQNEITQGDYGEKGYTHLECQIRNKLRSDIQTKLKEKGLI